MLLRLYGLFFLVSALLFGYSDNDIDGVDDSIDLCPNTAFDQLVDKNGCPQNKLFPGKLILQIGSDTSFNQIDETISNLNIYANYMIKEWNFSLSNSNYYVTNLANDIAENSLYLTTGYTVVKDKIRARFSLGTKFDLTNRDSNEQKRDNDYYTSVNVEYYFAKKQNLFFYYSYTLSGDSDTVDYQNFQSLSAGYGYAMTDKWYTALSYNYAQNYYPDTDDYKAVSWFNSYRFSETTYAILNYAHTFDDISYSHIVTFSIGFYFD
jgi:hypothetical protein